jgi:hypothetical protein
MIEAGAISYGQNIRCASSRHSGRLSVVVPQKSAQPLATLDASRAARGEIPGKQQDVASSLMIALSVKVRNIFGERPPQ